MGNNVENPDHYKGTYGLECIEAIRNALTPEEFRGFCKGCAIKYLWREANKGENEDLEKTCMYIDFLIEDQNKQTDCLACKHLRKTEDRYWCNFFYQYISLLNHYRCELFERKDDGEQE